MGALTEILDGVEAIAKSISDIGKIIEAIQKGKDYFEKRYKDAKNDVKEILEEINKTLITTSSATSILTHFSFVDDPKSYAADLREFNNRIVDGKSEIDRLRQDIDEYRGHCSKIRYHADRIKEGNKLDYLFRIFGIDSEEENKKLSATLLEIYETERDHYLTVHEVCDNLRKAIDHVHETLGGPGLIQPGKVPEAAALLSEYGRAFMKIESAANHRVFQIRELIRALS
ncbi:MAG: hypothetical protein A4E66_00378 [Syntrophus sp. PtaB.Bin001]|nr:MAG: hypothetical protein A4E66_00378 [Syntrophus sp. PtaB.Bin001]